MESNHYPDHQAKPQKLPAMVPSMPIEIPATEKEMLQNGYCMRIPKDVVQRARKLAAPKTPLQSFTAFVGALFG